MPFKEKLKEAGFTTTLFGKIAGKHVSTVSKWCNNPPRIAEFAIDTALENKRLRAEVDVLKKKLYAVGEAARTLKFAGESS